MKASFFHRSKSVIALVAGLLLTVGCGTDKSPVAPTTGTSQPGISQHSPDQPESAKLLRGLLSTVGGIPTSTVGMVGTTVSQLVSPLGGTLVVLIENDPGPLDDIYVHLNVPTGGVSIPVSITMTVYGEELSEMVVDFAPDGFLFLLDAELRMELGNDLVDIDPDSVEVVHEHSDGSSELAKISSINENTNSVQINVVAPGFSRYGVRSRSW